MDGEHLKSDRSRRRDKNRDKKASFFYLCFHLRPFGEAVLKIIIIIIIVTTSYIPTIE